MVFFWAEDVENPGATNWRPLGSGFLVSDQGVVLTAKHVIESLVTGERIIGSISSKSTFPVPIDETDIQCAMANRDACAVRIPSGAIPPSVDQVFDVECTDLPLDTKLRALGFTGGGDRFGGIIQPRGEVVGAAMRAGLIPTDLDLVPTMSGGPVLNDRGNVVAIVKGADSISDNLTFVTPITSIKPILESLNVQCDEAQRQGSILKWDFPYVEKGGVTLGVINVREGGAGVDINFRLRNTSAETLYVKAGSMSYTDESGNICSKGSLSTWISGDIAWRSNHEPTSLPSGVSIQYSGVNIRCDSSTFGESGDIIAKVAIGETPDTLSWLSYEISGVRLLK
ncbi:S1 family peptidase [Aliiroseovarius sp. 2305UL8-7]|uniref:S1 family peptidase n=1 Tax=Aliiroseovarius conchicola TaxID=3121637 RepID=UPI003528267D